MFYDAFAALIGQSGDALQARQASPSQDPRFLREGRQIATFLRRTSAIWSDLFTALRAETEVLERGLDEANALLRAHGRDPTSALPSHPAAAAREPLEYYRALNRALDSTIESLASLAREARPRASSETKLDPWVSEALRGIRNSLAEASAIQGRLVDRMLEVR